MKRLYAVALFTMACSVSPETEEELGAKWATQVESELTLSRDTALDAYVDQLGARLAAVADSIPRNWQFTVVESDELNAFAIPGGRIYVNRGLIATVDSSSELAGVLGHEVAHVVLRHSMSQIEKRTKVSAVVSIFCSLTGWCAGDMAQVALEVGGAALFAKYSRQDESASDSAAVNYLRKAGIDPRGVAALFGKLEASRGDSPALLNQFFGSHPLDADRVSAAKALVDRIPAAELDTLTRHDPQFEAVRPSGKPRVVAP
jgi:predicted Zn-dependent protease